ncbi:MAG: hypothetical protein WCI22_01510 [Actinomycetota bacterium]
MRTHPDNGFATPVEMMFLVVFAVLAMVFLGFLGRLHAAGVQVTTVAQSAARAASLESGPIAARAAADSAVTTSALATRCSGTPRARMSWSPSPLGTWQGGSVTISVSCALHTRALTGLWSPGVHTVTMSDTQPIDRYHR